MAHLTPTYWSASQLLAEHERGQLPMNLDQRWSYRLFFSFIMTTMILKGGAMKRVDKEEATNLFTTQPSLNIHRCFK